MHCTHLAFSDPDLRRNYVTPWGFGTLLEVEWARAALKRSGQRLVNLRMPPRSLNVIPEPAKLRIAFSRSTPRPSGTCSRSWATSTKRCRPSSLASGWRNPRLPGLATRCACTCCCTSVPAIPTKMRASIGMTRGVVSVWVGDAEGVGSFGEQPLPPRPDPATQDQPAYQQRPRRRFWHHDNRGLAEIDGDRIAVRSKYEVVGGEEDIGLTQ